MNLLKTTLAGAALAVLGGAASAATVTFDGASAGNHTNYTEAGFVFDEIRINNGNCDSASGQPCGAENKNETSTMTRVGGGTFDMVSMWFQLLGKSTPMTLTTDHGSLSFGDAWGHNDGGHVVELPLLSTIFTNITFLTITDAPLGKGNLRFDDLTMAVAPVPLPATGLLLLAGVGGIAALRRRRTA